MASATFVCFSTVKEPNDSQGTAGSTGRCSMTVKTSL